MRRLFIMRKDLHMSTGKLLAQTCHCAEAYWTRELRKQAQLTEDERRYVRPEIKITCSKQKQPLMSLGLSRESITG